MSGVGWSMAGLACVLSIADPNPQPTATQPSVSPHVAEAGDSPPRLHLQLDGNAAFGIGGQMFLGSRLHFTGYRAVWNRRRAVGTIDGGVQLLYGNEPVFLAPWIDGTQIDGAAHHVHALVTAGHTIHVGKRRRVGLGAHLFGGLNHWTSSYRVHYGDEDVEGRRTVRRNHFIGGGQLEVDVRLARRVGLNFVLGAPFPTQTSYAITMLFVGLGPTFYLR